MPGGGLCSWQFCKMNVNAAKQNHTHRRSCERRNPIHFSAVKDKSNTPEIIRKNAIRYMAVSLNKRKKTHSDTFQCRKKQVKRTENHQKKPNPIHVSAVKRTGNHAKKSNPIYFSDVKNKSNAPKIFGKNAIRCMSVAYAKNTWATLEPAEYE